MKQRDLIPLALAFLSLVALVSSGFEKPSVVSVSRDKVNYFNGHVLTWDPARNLLLLDGEIADQVAVLGVVGDRVIVRLKAISLPLSVYPPFFSTAKNFITLDGGPAVSSSPVSARVGQTLRLGTEISGLPSFGRVIVFWVLEQPGGATLTSSEARALPFSGRIDSPTTAQLIAGTYTLSTTLEISEFELGASLFSAPPITIAALGTSTAPATSTNDSKAPSVSCLPSTFDPVPRTTPLLFKCTVYDPAGVAGVYGKVNGATTTAQFLYDNSSGQWTYLVPSSSYNTGEVVNKLTVTAIDSSSNANIAIVDFPFLVQSSGETTGSLNGSRLPIPGATSEPILSFKTPVPAVSPAPALAKPSASAPGVAISQALAPLLKVLGIPLWLLLAVLAVLSYLWTRRGK